MIDETHYNAYINVLYVGDDKLLEDVPEVLTSDGRIFTSMQNELTFQVKFNNVFDTTRIQGLQLKATPLGPTNQVEMVELKAINGDGETVIMVNSSLTLHELSCNF